ncbi:MAG: aminoacetone oxidase family FAD-binding enzyme [Bacilli bacterium]|nr:aminoacetone oxidase family FAD-binding enzyme [Bacilli bacterium]
MKKIVIIGGGVSGVVCAIHAKNKDNEVILLERNKEVLKKLLMTGNGRCNYYNENQSIENYYSNSKIELEKIVTKENTDKVLSFYENLGIIPKIKNGYYYPYSLQAISIKNALIEELKEKNIKVITNIDVKEINKKDDLFEIICNNQKIICNQVVVSTGSCAYKKTGSDGSGYNLLKKYHTIIKPLPSLVPLISNHPNLKNATGVRSEVSLELFEENQFKKKEEGELQITDYGISGICTFNLSGIVSRGLNQGKKEIIKINFAPFIKTLISPWLEDYSKKHPNKNISSLLEGFLNIKIVDTILKESNIKKDRYYKDLEKEEKIKLINSLRHFKVEIISTKGFDFSQTVTGGVSLEEINPYTFESKIIKNLYIIGELLDMDGICGGYNLTLAVLTGILSGEGIQNDTSKTN